MRRLTAHIAVFILGFLFTADAVNVDIVVADVLNSVFHTQIAAIGRDEMNGTGKHAVTSAVRSITSPAYVAQDEDSPPMLDARFPALSEETIMPAETDIPVEGRIVSPSFLSLCTLLI